MGSLRIAVIGGGIAGLTVAIALKRSGVDCTVYERHAGPTGAGAGIQLAPNGTRLLHRLGLAERLDAVAVVPEAIEMRRWSTNSTLRRVPLGDSATTRYGAPYLTVHRADLYRVLRETAGAIDVRQGHRCVAVTESRSTVEVHLSCGATHRADVVLAADGIRSTVRAGWGDAPARYRGLEVYRGVIPANRSPAVTLWFGPGRHLVCYPVGGGRSSFVASVPGPSAGLESWTQPGDPSVLAAHFAGWTDEVREILAAAGPVTRWALHDRPPPRRLCSRRVALIGDAAHPMLPFGAQGANQAVEDAVACAAHLRDASRADVPAALHRYELARRPRRARVAAMVTRHHDDHHLPDGDDQRRRDERLGADESLASFDWLFGHDAERAARGDPPGPAVLRYGEPPE